MARARLNEVDALRGLAVCGMLLYHAVWIGNYFGLMQVDLGSAGVEFWAAVGRILFLGLVGVSVFLSSRSVAGQAVRALQIGAAAALVTAVSWVVFPQEFVRFGVLHCIAISVLVARLLKSWPRLAGLLGLLVVGLGTWGASSFGAWVLLWSRSLGGAGEVLGEVPGLWGDVGGVIAMIFGFPSGDFSSVDYFPLFPWVGVSLLGLFWGWLFYRRGTGTPLVILEKVPGLLWLGRHALAIYLLHLPLLYISLWGLSLAL